jgi:N-methylhydantoinase B
MACLAQALPEATPAASSGAIAIVLLSAMDPETGERRITVAQPLTGGSGARPRQDGIDGTSFTGGWLRNVPNEVLEAEMPVLVEHYGYREGSAAPGERRGGAGITFRLRNLAPDSVMTARGLERFRFRPWGFAGGDPGAVTTVRLNPGRPAEQRLGRFDLLALGPGDVVEFNSSSGGGYGDPLRRAPDKVLADIRAGFLDARAAHADYGVVVRDGAVDDAATARERAARPPRTARFAAGDERAEFEAIWPETLQRDLIAVLMQQRSAVRGFLRERLEAFIAAERQRGRLPDRAALERRAAAIVGGHGGDSASSSKREVEHERA